MRSGAPSLPTRRRPAWTIGAGASQTGVTPFECDLAELTDASRRSLARAVGHGAGPDGGREPASGSGPAAVGSGTARSKLDPALLDAAFDVIGRHLDGDDPLPSDAALASCLGEVARTFGARGGGDSPADVWRARLAALRELDPSDVSRRASSLTRTGLGLLPAGLRTRAVWAGVGGLLGVAACAAAAATVAPVALVALPGWAATGAGLAGLLSLVRAGDDRTGSAQAAGAAGSPSDEARRLGEAVFAAAASAVLWWSQGADEARTTRALEVLVSDDTVPTLDGATRDRITATFGFFGDEALAVTFEIKEVLGNVDFLRRASLERVGLWAAAGAAAGAGVGAMGDIATGGVSLGGFTVLGAALEPVSIDSAVKESLAGDADPAWRASWKSARGRAAWSDLSLPRPNGVAGHARAETVKKVAAALAAGVVRSNAGA